MQPSSFRQPPARQDHVENTTHDKLRHLVGRDHDSLQHIAALLEEIAAVWQEISALDSLAKDAHPKLHSFNDEQVQLWINLFVTTLEEEALFFSSAPSRILEMLMSPQPDLITDRAWLVMFYSIALSTMSTHPSDDPVKVQLRSNLWLSFNDARLLLEPNLLSVQALVLMACRLEEYMTPSTYWTLINKSCVMLQALGITNGRLDRAMQDQRASVFWRLNFVDQALALILCRQPTLHRQVAIQTPPPTVSQLLAIQPYRVSGRSSLFHAHYTHQMHLLSSVMADVCGCVYAPPDPRQTSSVEHDLAIWYTQATEVLKAAALTEKPLLTPADTATVDLSLRILDFQYYALLVRLALSSKETIKTKAVNASLKLLRLLPSLHDVAVSSKEIFPFPLWQWLYFPLPAFGLLWGQVITGVNPQHEQSKRILEVIELLPAFFGTFTSRTSIAKRLEDISQRMIQHATSILHSNGDSGIPVYTSAEHPETQSLQPVHEHGSTHPEPYHSSTLFNPVPDEVPLDVPAAQSIEPSFDATIALGNDALLNNFFDWIAWDKPGVAGQPH